MDFTLRSGEVHALLGVNGAGKSTLVKIICGAEPPDSGTMKLENQIIQVNDTADAMRHGIVVVYQERTLIPHFTVAENIMLGKEPANGQLIRRRDLHEQAERLLNRLGVEMDLNAEVIDLGAGQQQLVDIVRALRTEPKVMVLDEPTAALSQAETKHLFELLRQFKNQGIGIIFVSHRLDEVFEISDSLTILRDGRIVSSGPISEYTPARVTQDIVGHNVAKLEVEVKSTSGPVLMETQDLCSEDFNSVNLKIASGEVVGLAGVVGAGRTELLETLVGFRRADSGKIMLKGKHVQINSPEHAIRHGIVLVPDKRIEKGLLNRMNVLENLTVSSLQRYSNGMGWLQRKKLHDVATRTMDQLRIMPPSLTTSVQSLSGGNKQKVVFGKWLTWSEDVNGLIFMFDEPTEGVDVGARADMWVIIRNLAAQGAAVLVTSSDLDELMDISDRLYVMRRGKIVSEGVRRNYTHDSVLQLMMGG
ncbi:MAG: sugar ABC transporter ATP-binding protein [Anaerolineae bacterium]|nr:sugar ABC transporter ATP-binding protein [Anaerolineae bacterium]